MLTISIGTEPMQWVPAKVLAHSIIKRTTCPVRFTYSWTPEQRWHEAFRPLPKLPNGTEFSLWRWLVPEVHGRRGRVVYCDADQAVLGDVAELLNLDLGQACLAAVRGATGYFDKPMGGKPVRPDALQTSVMVMQADRCPWACVELVQRVHDGLISYSEMMQARWLGADLIAPLDPNWNVFNVAPTGSKLVHWTCVRNQPYRNPSHETAWLFLQELSSALEAGYVSRDEVKNAVKEGHLHGRYLDA